jgi:hypothetical protein
MNPNNRNLKSDIDRMIELEKSIENVIKLTVIKGN